MVAWRIQWETIILLTNKAVSGLCKHFRYIINQHQHQSQVHTGPLNTTDTRLDRLATLIAIEHMWQLKCKRIYCFKECWFGCQSMKSSTRRSGTVLPIFTQTWCTQIRDIWQREPNWQHCSSAYPFLWSHVLTYTITEQNFTFWFGSH